MYVYLCVPIYIYICIYIYIYIFMGTPNSRFLVTGQSGNLELGVWGPTRDQALVSDTPP